MRPVSVKGAAAIIKSRGTSSDNFRMLRNSTEFMKIANLHRHWPWWKKSFSFKHCVIGLKITREILKEISFNFEPLELPIAVCQIAMNEDRICFHFERRFAGVRSVSCWHRMGEASALLRIGEEESGWKQGSSKYYAREEELDFVKVFDIHLHSWRNQRFKSL